MLCMGSHLQRIKSEVWQRGLELGNRECLFAVFNRFTVSCKCFIYGFLEEVLFVHLFGKGKQEKGAAAKHAYLDHEDSIWNTPSLELHAAD